MACSSTERNKRNSCILGAFVAVYVVSSIFIPQVEGKCPKSANGNPYRLTIGHLTIGSTFATQRVIQEHIKRTGNVLLCFQEPQHISLNVRNMLKLETDGWTEVQSAIKSALHSQGADNINIIIGPFYTNLAMVLERMNIPYLVTDYKGYKWIDMSRVQDTTNWATMVEIRPAAQGQNLAVLDYFKLKEWKNAVMVMPESSSDNQECQNLAYQMIKGGVSLIPYTVNSESNHTKEMTKEVLRSVQLSRQKHVIVCSPRDDKDQLIKSVLVQAKRFNLLLNKDQIFIFVDPSSFLEPFATPGNMYQLGLFSARCKLLAFRYVVPRNLVYDTVNEAVALDAAHVVTMALHTYINQQSGRTNKFSSKRFLRALREVDLPDALTGSIRFDEHGKRANYTLHLYNHGGEDMYRKEAEWTPDGSSVSTRLNVTGFGKTSDSAKTYGIFPGIVRIVVVMEEPFVMYKFQEPGIRYSGNERFEGFTIDLLKKLAHRLRFEYEIYESPLNGYGVEVKDGLWDGMVHEILTGNATLAMGAISITSKRETAIDFSLGIISTGVNILIKKPEETFNIFQFMKPFSLNLWFAIVGASVFVSLVFFFLDYFNVERKFTVKETAWYSIGTLLKRGTDFSPKPISQRILSAGFTFFVLITASTYTANMAAFLTTKNLGKAVTTFEALADSDLAVGTVKNSATMNFLSRGNQSVFQRLWYRIESSKGLVQNATYGRQLVANGKYAFIFDYLINSYSEIKYCKTKAVASPILVQEHGIGMKAGAPFKTIINIQLLRLKENGFIHGLKKRWWDDKRQCDVKGSTKADNVEFGVLHMAGVFIVGLFGFIFSVCFFLSKKLYFRSKAKNEEKPDSTVKETRLLCKGSPTSV